MTFSIFFCNPQRFPDLGDNFCTGRSGLLAGFDFGKGSSPIFSNFFLTVFLLDLCRTVYFDSKDVSDFQLDVAICVAGRIPADSNCLRLPPTKPPKLHILLKLFSILKTNVAAFSKAACVLTIPPMLFCTSHFFLGSVE